MNLFDVIAILVVLAAVFGFVNKRYFKLEATVGMMLIALASSLALVGLHHLFPDLGVVSAIRDYLANIDFNRALMEGMLGFLLFAGALHVDLDFFAQKKWAIASLATIGLLISMSTTDTCSTSRSVFLRPVLWAQSSASMSAFLASYSASVMRPLSSICLSCWSRSLASSAAIGAAGVAFVVRRAKNTINAMTPTMNNSGRMQKSHSRLLTSPRPTVNVVWSVSIWP